MHLTRIMFNTLASYLLGSTVNNDIGSKTVEENSTAAETLQNLTIAGEKHKNLLDEDTDDDWLIVDKEEVESAPNTDSEEELPFVEIKNAPAFPRGRHSRNNSGAGSRDGLLSLSPTSFLPNSMEESWFVTPPPCFTSVGPIIMETSPLENLLIEHPSMSVYHSIRTSMRGDVDADDEEIVVLDTVHLHPAAERSPTHTIRVGRNRTEHVDNIDAQQVEQYLLRKSFQKCHDRKTRQSLARTALERSNKVREVNSKGGRQKRSDMNHCKVISRANNNRKC